MLEFVIDKKGNEGESWERILEKQVRSSGSGSEEEDDTQNLIPLDDLPDSECTEEKSKKNCGKNDFSLENAYLITNYSVEGPQKNERSCVDKLLEKSTLYKGLEKLKAVPVKKSRKALQRERKAEREKTKGKDWYNLPATEVTEEIKNDLEILKMRSALDSKHFYKKNDLKVIPKYFQVGKVVEGAADFYNGRVPKSQRKRTLVDELLADSNFKAYQKKKYKEIVDDKRRKKRKPVREKKNLKKNLKDEWLSWD